LSAGDNSARGSRPFSTAEVLVVTVTEMRPGDLLTLERCGNTRCSVASPVAQWTYEDFERRSPTEVYTEGASYVFTSPRGIVGAQVSVENGVTNLRFSSGMEVSVIVHASRPEVPLASGTYQFQWKDAEFARSDGFPVRVEIVDNRMQIFNDRKYREVPVGKLEDGELMWHPKSSQWILGHAETDKFAATVGGCAGSDPFAVDFDARVIWTCMWGP
jgi:hypothetical protein